MLNVLRGEMSLVGPRPLPAARLRAARGLAPQALLVLPGMTGLWQISGRSDLSFDDLVRLDFYYLENWSIWLDISILAKTLPGRARRAAARTERDASTAPRPRLRRRSRRATSARRPDLPARARRRGSPSRLGLGPGTTVVDVGAGTGKLTRELVPTGARVIAVEPLPEMREQLEAAVPGRRGARRDRPRSCRSPDGSADAVTVAAAFHWFDTDRALPEIHRVLKPGRRARDRSATAATSTEPLQRAVQDDRRRRTSRTPARSLGWRAGVEASPLFGPPEDVRDARSSSCSTPTGSPSGSGRSATSRGCPTTSAPTVLARVRALGEAQPADAVPVPVSDGRDGL